MRESKSKTSLYSLLLLGIYSGGILIAYLLPANTQKTVDQWYFLEIRGDYLIHAALFTPLCPLLYINFCSRNQSNLILWMLTGVTMAMAAEGIHYLLPYRSFNILDLFANATGASIGALFVLMLHYSRRKAV